MKISFFDFTINFGGAPQGSLYLMKRLKEAGHECYIIDAYGLSKSYKNKSLLYNLDYYALYKQTKNVTLGDKRLLRLINIIKQSPVLFTITIRLIKYLKKTKPNIVFVNNEKSLFFLYLARPFIEFKIILYFRGEGIASQLSPRFIKSINYKTDHVIAHSKLAVQNLKNAGVNSSKLSYVPNCIEEEKFTAPEKSTDLPSNGNFKIILTAARFLPDKGYHIAIEAIKILKDEGYLIDLYLPGVVPTGVTSKYKDYINSLIISYQLQDTAHFIGWRENLAQDIAFCDLVVLPSHTEGFPRSIIEAMIHGTPVCATPVGGIPEAIKHMETGLLFEIDNVKNLVDCIKLLINNKSLYKKISKNSKIFSRQYFHPQNNTESIINILNML